MGATGSVALRSAIGFGTSAALAEVASEQDLASELTAVRVVLESFYEVPAEDVAQLVRSVVAFAPTRTLDPALLLRSLEICEMHRIDYAEAYLAASAEQAGVTDIASLDRSIDRVPTVTRIEP